MTYNGCEELNLRRGDKSRWCIEGREGRDPPNAACSPQQMSASQVVLSGESKHGQPSFDSGPSAQNGFPSLRESSAVGSSVSANGVAAHPLQLYCEYLSYLFRRPPLPQGQEDMEIGYRDYLQVRTPESHAMQGATTAKLPTAD